MAAITGIKAVLFDIDDTLFPSTEFAERARLNAAQAMVAAGMGGSKEEVLAKLHEIVKKRGSNYGGHFDDLCGRFKCADPDRIVAAGIVAYHNTKSSIQPYPDAIRTLLELRDRGYYLGVASEGHGVKQWDKLIRLGLDHLFHGVFVTNEKAGGKTKAFYSSVAKKIKFKPGEILMVGNNPEKDIKPAASAGMKVARVRLGRWTREKARADADLLNLQGLLALLPQIN